jgi:hypothetical protein
MLPAKSNVVDPSAARTPDRPWEDQVALAPSLLVGFINGKVDFSVKCRFSQIVQVDQVRWLWGSVGVYLTSALLPLLTVR